MRVATRKKWGIAAWMGVRLIPVCLLAVVPVNAQSIAPKLDHDRDARRLQDLGRLPLDSIGAASPRLSSTRPDSPAAAIRRQAPSRPGFFAGHLMPGMERQLSRVAPIHAMESHRATFEASVMHERFSDLVESRASRAGLRAARTYLHEETALGAWVDSFRVGKHGVGKPHQDQALDFGFGVSHGVPKLGMRHRAAAGTTRFSLGIDGNVRVEFRPTRLQRTKLNAGYDPDRSLLQLSYRLGF